MPPRPKKIEVNSELAHRIRELRESREETQTSFAVVLGVRPSNVSKWESGTNPEPQIIVRLANLAQGELKTYFLRQAGVTAQWDPELLTFVIENVNSKLKQMRKKLSDREYATLVAHFYDLCLRSGRRDLDKMDELLKIA